MDWDDYLRDQAADYRQLAETAEIRSSGKNISNWRQFVRKWRITSRIA
jgi:hypothetical protein